MGNVLYPKTDDPKINALKKAAKKENFEIQKERTLTHAKNFGGAALILGTGLVPGVGEARVTVGLAKTLGPIVGKKIAETAAKGIIKGPIQGAVAGLGEGLINDENLLKSVARGSGIGLAAGATIGLGVGKLTQNIEAAALRKAADKVNNSNLTKKIPKEDKKKYIKQVKEYYKDYERGRNIENKNLGKIRFMSDAIKETNMQNLDNSNYVVDLSINIKNAKYIRAEEPVHNHKYDIVKFHRLGGDDVDYLIAENAKGEFYFYKVVEKLLDNK